MNKPNLSALQNRARILYESFDKTSGVFCQSTRLEMLTESLSEQTQRLHAAQIGPFTHVGDEPKSIHPILIEQLTTLFIIAPELNLDLGEAMSRHSEVHQQQLLQTMASCVSRMHRIMKRANFLSLQPDELVSMRPLVTDMTWRVETELRGRGVDIEAALETYWTDLYDLDQPSRSAYKKTPARAASPSL